MDFKAIGMILALQEKRAFAGLSKDYVKKSWDYKELQAETAEEYEVMTICVGDEEAYYLYLANGTVVSWDYDDDNWKD